MAKRLSKARPVPRRSRRYFIEMASPAIETVRAIIVTLKTNAIRPWAVAVRRIVHEVMATSDTAVDVPITNEK